MERPDLQYNYYFPFYTQKRTGKKTYFYIVDTVIHLSEEEGILLQLKYKKNKISEVKVSKLADRKNLYDERFSGTLIHYTAFAEEVSTAFLSITSAMKMLSSSKSYCKNFIFNTFFKHNENVEMELEYKQIQVTFDRFDYVIENGKKKKPEPTICDGDGLLRDIGLRLSALDSQITYTEIEDSVFNEKLDYIWDNFADYFKCPKVMKKTKYVPQ